MIYGSLVMSSSKYIFILSPSEIFVIASDTIIMSASFSASIVPDSNDTIKPF